MYDESLKFTNRVLNAAFGYTVRRVPAHMPHFVSVSAVRQLQARFPAEYDSTSSHKFRAKDDMQFSFAYYSFLLHQLKNATYRSLLDQTDRNRNGLLDRFEFEFVLVRVAKETPVHQEVMDDEAQSFLTNCIYRVNRSEGNITTTMRWKSVRLESLENCTWLQSLITNASQRQPLYRYQLADDSSVWFKMLSANFNSTFAHLQQIVHEPRKFLCLNDDVNYSDPEAVSGKLLLKTFLDSFFPVRSEFELAENETNRFGYLHRLTQTRADAEVPPVVHFGPAIKAFLSIMCLLLLLVYSLRRKMRRLCPSVLRSALTTIGAHR